MLSPFHMLSFALRASGWVRHRDTASGLRSLRSGGNKEILLSVQVYVCEHFLLGGSKNPHDIWNSIRQPGEGLSRGRNNLNKSPQAEKQKVCLGHNQRLSLIGARSGERLWEMRLIHSPAVWTKEQQRPPEVGREGLLGEGGAPGGQLKSFLLCVCAQSLSCDLTRFLGPWDFPGRNTGVGCHFLLQGIFLTQESNPHPWHLLLSQWILYHCTTWEASFKLLKHSLYHW